MLGSNVSIRIYSHIEYLLHNTAYPVHDQNGLSACTFPIPLDQGTRAAVVPLPPFSSSLSLSLSFLLHLLSLRHLVLIR